MHATLTPLVCALLLGLGASCTAASPGGDGLPSGGEASGSGADTAADGHGDDGADGGDQGDGEGGAEETGASDSTSGDGDTTGAGGDAEGTGGGTDGTPPATCLDGKVGVFDVNTDSLYRSDPDFVVHSYPTNDPDESPGNIEDFFARVEADPSIDENFLFASGFSYGATMSLIHGYLASDRLAGIIHLSQYSAPSHWEDELYEAARRIPVYIIHDDSYDGGGQHLRQTLLGVGYQDGVDLFYLDFVGGHSAPSPAEMATVLEWMKTMSLNGPCDS